MNNSKYINEDNNVIPPNNIVIVSHPLDPHTKNETYKQIIDDFKENSKRDWFTQHFYFCLPLLIGNQYGFGIKSLYNFKAIWDGGSGTEAIKIEIEDYPKSNFAQRIESHFGHGVITLSHYFVLRTEPGMNLMILPPANHYNSNLISMTAVVETDNLRRDFTFNLKIMEPNKEVIVKKGDVLSGFIPIPRYFIDNFALKSAEKIFNNDTLNLEFCDIEELGKQRDSENAIGKNNIYKPFIGYGRKYFKGIHAFGKKFVDHQIKINKL